MLPCLGALFEARELARVAPAMVSRMISTKIYMYPELGFLGGRSWD
jgi:hypothetical protein